MTYTFVEYTPPEYLMIDIATNYGMTEINNEPVDLDKVDFEDRIKWFKEQEAAGQLANLIHTADNPALYFSGLTAYSDMLDGKPIGYPISLDACSSGLQLLSLFANCESSARRCGIVNTGKREDAYTSLFYDMKSAATFPMDATRKEMKQGIMTSLYGSTAQPKILFGEGTPALELFYKILEQEIPGAWALNLALKDLWQPFASEHEWTTPDGFEVSMTVEDVVENEVSFLGQPVQVFTKQLKGTPTGRSLSPNVIHSIDGMVVREIQRRCNYDRNQIKKVREIVDVALRRKDRRESGKGRGRKKDIILSRLWDLYLRTDFFSARVLDVIDEKNINLVSAARVKQLLDTLPIEPFPVITVHDCFRVHPNYGNDLRRQYNRILSELAASDTLSDIATQITGRRKYLKKLGDISADILNANYALS